MLLKVLFMAFVMTVTTWGCSTSDDDKVNRIAQLVRAADYPALGELLTHDDLELRCRAAKALTWVTTPKAAAQHKQLLGLMGCSWKIRSEAAWRLMEEKAPGWQSLVIPLLKDNAREVRWNVARILGTRGTSEAVTALSSGLKDSDPFVAAWCRWALCKIDKKGGCKKPNMDLRNGKTGP